MRTKTLCLTAALAALSPLALAQSNIGNLGFDAYDTDGSGSVERQEFVGAIDDASTFRNWDADNDGQLSQNEFREIGLDGDFIDWDTNQDSYLNNNEFSTGTFNTFDSDGNGYLESQEMDDAGDAGLFDV